MTTIISGSSPSVQFSDGSQQTSAMAPFKNRIINGAMMIDQRNAGASVTPTTNGQYTLDRWASLISQSSKYSVQQNAGSITPPVGFVNYLGVTSLSAYSILSTDYFAVSQAIEGFNFGDLFWGTANAQTVTLSFKVYSSLTGTFGGSLQNNNSSRNYPFSYSIPVANTWTTISITIAGDTSGTWLANSSTGVRINWGLGVGSTLSGTAGAWSGTAYLSATGATSVVGTSGATFYITGVQLEVGSAASSFDYRPYGTELALCRRYYSKQNATILGSVDTTNTLFNGSFGTPMRSSPTVSFTCTFTPATIFTSIDYWATYTGGLSNAQSISTVFANAEL